MAPTLFFFLPPQDSATLCLPTPGHFLGSSSSPTCSNPSSPLSSTTPILPFPYDSTSALASPHNTAAIAAFLRELLSTLPNCYMLARPTWLAPSLADFARPTGVYVQHHHQQLHSSPFPLFLQGCPDRPYSEEISTSQDQSRCFTTLSYSLKAWTESHLSCPKQWCKMFEATSCCEKRSHPEPS